MGESMLLRFNGSGDRTIKIIDSESGHCLKVLSGHGRTPWVVYRASDLELVSVLPNAEVEVNVACFHTSAEGGLVYGTKVCIYKDN